MPRGKKKVEPEQTEGFVWVKNLETGLVWEVPEAQAKYLTTPTEVQPVPDFEIVPAPGAAKAEAPEPAQEGQVTDGADGDHTGDPAG